MRVPLKTNAEHVEGLTLGPVSASIERVEAWDREITITGQEDLEANLLRLDVCRKVLRRGGLISQASQLDQVVEAHQLAAGALVVATLHLQVIETRGLQGRSDHRKEGRLNANDFNAQVIGLEQLVIKTLAGEPLADRASLGCSNGSGVLRHRSQA